MPSDPAGRGRGARVTASALDGPSDVVRWLTRLARDGTFTRPTMPPVPGEPLDPIRISGDALSKLFPGAARRTLGGTGVASRVTEVIWSDGGDELAVDPGKVEVRTTAGAIAVMIPVRCDETGPATVQIAFAIGAPDRAAGLYAATEDRPRGPAAVVDRWADPLIAFAWSAVLELAGSVAGAVARDQNGDPLIPGALVATDAGLEITPFARHQLGPLQT